MSRASTSGRPTAEETPTATTNHSNDGAGRHTTEPWSEHPLASTSSTVPPKLPIVSGTTPQSNLLLSPQLTGKTSGGSLSVRPPARATTPAGQGPLPFRRAGNQTNDAAAVLIARQPWPGAAPPGAAAATAAAGTSHLSSTKDSADVFAPLARLPVAGPRPTAAVARPQGSPAKSAAPASTSSRRTIAPTLVAPTIAAKTKASHAPHNTSGTATTNTTTTVFLPSKPAEGRSQPTVREPASAQAPPQLQSQESSQPQGQPAKVSQTTRPQEKRSVVTSSKPTTTGMTAPLQASLASKEYTHSELVEIRSYLLESNATKIFQSLTQALDEQRPEDPVSFILDMLCMYQETKAFQQ